MATVESIFVGCNRQLEILDYNAETKQLAYGAHHLVALYKPFDEASRGVTSTLKHHTKEVTCVKWLPESEYLISTSEDATVAIWHQTQLVQTLVDHHKSSITALAVLNSDIFVTGDALGVVIIWGRVNGSSEEAPFVKLHEFSVKPGFLPLSLALEKLNSTTAADDYVLALGGTNTLLYIYSFSLDRSEHLNVADVQFCAALPGHEDWIKLISFKKEADNSWLVASGSQDRYIRLWRLRTNEAIDHSDEDPSKLLLLSNKQHKFRAGATPCSVSFDSIIMGHDDWISSLKWHPHKIQLLSSSADTSIMVWEPDHVSGVWISTARLGEISIKGASTATGASGGFWAAAWIFENGHEYVFTNGKTGSLRMWQSELDSNVWTPKLTTTGSLKPVTDLSWSEHGEYLLSTSLDQTTRLFAVWQRPGHLSWHEFARPQIHGYDMVCLATLSSTRFISGGDEKILRSFDLPHSVAQMLSKLCGLTLHSETMPQSASLPVLGLSNKAETVQESLTVADGSGDGAEQGQNGDEPEPHSNTNDILASLDQPPLEDVLQRHTLFPEIEKLYGHGYEITTVATSNDKTLIATSCRSNSVQHAVIRVFQLSNWQQLDAPLAGHNLTVTRLAFSKDDKYLVGVSRDRQFSLWRRELHGFELVKLMEKLHSRIIWDVAFVPLEFMHGRGFFTVSRDKFIKLWEIREDGVELKSSLKCADAITCCDCLRVVTAKGSVVLAVGSETGLIDLYSVSLDGEFCKLLAVDDKETPGGRINRVAFSTGLAGDKVRFATASDDCSLRIFSVGGLLE